MSWRDLPSLSALRAFAAFAETGGVTPAAAALNVSHAAVSQQLRALEAHLDIALLDRTGRAMLLTPAGETLAQAVGLGFGAIRAAVQELGQSKQDRPLRITCTPALATNWLMPRLADFSAAHPEIDLAIDPRTEVMDLRPDGVDIALRFGRGQWPGLQAEPFFASPIVIVASPDLVLKHPVTTTEDLRALPWLDQIGPCETTRWLERRGLTPDHLPGRVTLPSHQRREAMVAGQGVTAIIRAFVEADIRAGRLVELFCDDADDAYYIVTRPGALRPSAELFRSWLCQQRDVMTV